MAVNVVAVKQLLAFTSPEWLEQVIYFSTASLLNRQLELLPEALSEGTEYIQTKALCLQQLEQHPLAERIVAVFPTLVFIIAAKLSLDLPNGYFLAWRHGNDLWAGS